MYHFGLGDGHEEGHCPCGNGDDCCQKTGDKDNCQGDCDGKKGIQAKPPADD